MNLRIGVGGKLIKAVFDNDKEEDREVNGSLVDYLGQECYLEPGVKLKDILALVRRDCVGLSCLLTDGPWLVEMIAEGDKPYIRDDNRLKYLEVYHYAAVDKYDDNSEIEQYVSFHGKGEEDGPFGLDFSPMNTLTELEVRLNPEVKMWDTRADHMKPVLLFTASKNFTLLDILRGIFYELSFYGSPTERDKQQEELLRTIKDIDDGTTELKEYDFGVK